jgi:hypothetical protein
MNLLRLIYTSLKIVYYSTTLYNHDLIRFSRFVFVDGEFPSTYP